MTDTALPPGIARRSGPAVSILTTTGPTAFPDGKEAIDYTFYDSVTLATAAAVTPALFQTPSVDDRFSNFQGAGSLPAGQAFYITGYRIVAAPGTGASDMVSLMNNVTSTFDVENAKKYVQQPMFGTPAGVGIDVQPILTGGAGVPTANNGFPSLGNAYRFRRAIVLRSQQSFKVTLNVRSTLTLIASVRVFCFLDGTLLRSVI